MVSRYRFGIEQMWQDHIAEQLKHTQDPENYDYRRFRIALLDVVWAWVFTARAILLWFVAFW